MLACLTLRQGDVVSADDLTDGVWGHAPPSTARKSLQNQIVRLRTIRRYLDDNASSILSGLLFGGDAAVSESSRTDAQDAICGFR